MGSVDYCGTAIVLSDEIDSIAVTRRPSHSSVKYVHGYPSSFVAVGDLATRRLGPLN